MTEQESGPSSSPSPSASSAPSESAHAPGQPFTPPPPVHQAHEGRTARRRYSPLAIVLGLSAAFFLIFLIISGIVFMQGGKSGGGAISSGAGVFGKGAVGVIEINGVIMDSKKALARLERFEESDQIKAVVLRLNSPGGSVAPSQEIYEAVKSYRKPIVASMGSVAASGAFYIACGAKKVFANPGTITGSIGVIMEFANLSKLYEWARVKRYSIKTGKFKDAGAEYREMEPDEKALLQGMVDNVLVQFKQAVADGRKLSMPAVDAIADGRILSGQQAKTVKLVDELGTIQDAINEAAKLGNIQGKPRVVYPERNRRRWLMELLDDNPSEESSFYDEEAVVAGPANGLNALLRGILAGGGERVMGQALTGLEPGIYWLWTGPR